MEEDKVRGDAESDEVELEDGGTASADPSQNDDGGANEHGDIYTDP